MVIKQGKSPYAMKTLLSSADYETYLDKHPEDLEFMAETGAEAVRQVLSFMDLALEHSKLRDEYGQTSFCCCAS